MLEVKDFCCGYGGTDVVKNINFTARTGEVLSVTGPNGCGKTTLLRALSGIIPYRGSALIDGEEIRSMKRHVLSSKTSLLSQTGAGGEYSAFTVLETVMLGRYAVQKTSGAAASASKHDLEAAESCLEKTGAAELRDRLITELSGGQLQRVFLARAFAQEPLIILLDEPANHLDLKHRLKLIEMLREWAEGGRTVIGVFHDLNLAAALSDRIMLMSGGEIAEIGKAAEICRSETLDLVYGFGVRDYMTKSLSFWSD